jgi:hypothetical protein
MELPVAPVGQQKWVVDSGCALSILVPFVAGYPPLEVSQLAPGLVR